MYIAASFSRHSKSKQALNFIVRSFIRNGLTVLIYISNRKKGETDPYEQQEVSTTGWANRQSKACSLSKRKRPDFLSTFNKRRFRLMVLPTSSWYCVFLHYLIPMELKTCIGAGFERWWRWPSVILNAKERGFFSDAAGDDLASRRPRLSEGAAASHEEPRSHSIFI